MCPSDPPPSRPPPLSPLIPGRSGRPTYSLEALRERVERQFHAETDGRDDILRELDTPAEQRVLLGDIADYLLAVESITLDARTRLALIEAARASLFSFGPLDPLIADDRVTEIAIDGPTTIAARRGLGRRARIDARFEDEAHLARVLERLLATGGTGAPDGLIVTEHGAMLESRRARITALLPPLSPAISVQIRLHPAQPHTLETLHEELGALPAEAVSLLDAIARGGFGLLITGEPGAGKTTLAGALALRLPPDEDAIAVERAAELSLPDRVRRDTASDDWPFANTLHAALDAHPAALVIDELRGEDASALWDVLARDSAPQTICVWRGAVEPDRLRSALNIAVRRQQPALPQETIDRALAARFSFIAALKETADGSRLAYLAETQLDGDTLRIVPLIEARDDAWRVTGEQPRHAIDWEDNPGE